MLNNNFVSIVNKTDHVSFNLYVRFGTCLLSKLSIPRLHDEDVSTIATHRPTKTVLQKEPYLQNKNTTTTTTTTTAQPKPNTTTTTPPSAPTKKTALQKRNP